MNPSTSQSCSGPSWHHAQLPAGQVGLHDDPVADAQPGDTLSELGDHPRELVPERDRHLLAGEIGCGDPAGGQKIGPSTYSCRSVPQMPHHSTRTFTCPGPACGSGTSSIRMSFGP